MKGVLALCLLLPAAHAWPQVTVEQAWARATPPGAKVAAGYLVVRNGGEHAERLVSVVTAAAARVETHVQERKDGVMRMREVNGYEIAPGGSLELRPGGAHLMFVQLRRPLKEGDKMPVTLEFARAGKVKVEFHVTGMGAMRHPGGSGQGAGSLKH
jgi:hypothetical protein